MVVEDDYLVSEEIVRSLKSIGYDHVLSVSSGVQAIKSLGAFAPNMIIMDIQMPGMNGLEASRRINDIKPTPVIILTAHETRDLMLEAGDAGVCAYLTKPPEAIDLQKAILIASARHEDLVKLRRLNQKLAERAAELEKALNEIKDLREIVPMCMKCKKVRDDDGFWHRVESYLRRSTGAEVSHGLCPDCSNELYPEFSSGEAGSSK